MIFPLAVTALHVVINGIPVRSFNPAFLRAGRVLAPLDPFLTSVVASIEYSGNVLIVRRADRFAQIAMPTQSDPGEFSKTFVAIGPVLRTLGISVSYDNARRTLYVRADSMPVTTPTPFNPAVPAALPQVVFTPSPQPTSIPKVTGSPLPRRTPLPADSQVPMI